MAQNLATGEVWTTQARAPYYHVGTEQAARRAGPQEQKGRHMIKNNKATALGRTNDEDEDVREMSDSEMDGIVGGWGMYLDIPCPRCGKLTLSHPSSKFTCASCNWSGTKL